MSKLRSTFVGAFIFLSLPTVTAAQCAPLLAWSSATVSERSVDSGARAQQIIEPLFDRDSDLSREVLKFQSDYKSELWNLYFQTYDRLVMYSPGYLDIFARVSQALPNEGTIADYGFGTGNGLMLLKRYAPGRRLIGTEPSPIGRERALSKLASAPQMYAELKDQNLFEYEPGDQRLDGAVLINVLYALPNERRLEALQRIHRHLKPHARLVISDPAPGLKDRAADVVRPFARRFVADAIAAGARPTEFELALFGFINIHALIGGNTFLDYHELQRLCEEAGFVIREHATAYYDVSHFVVLERF